MEWWKKYPSELVICQDAQKYGTTQERLLRHLIEAHGEPDWVVTDPCQAELENFHNFSHKNKKFNGEKHSHDKKIVIVGYEYKQKPQPKPYLTWEEYNK